ncbi:DNA-binding winged helix-turn-helix (wHTH) protein [Sphingobium sp. B11D3B]|uniref:hypothetical protein n=1 Tax=Sphingobium sp. B11D3B TaxID=2940575 RepID=UPI0022275875|nr:hypothetical protein [Sphingobium sp. B11D3B]MCW2387195.1 DNA-binding winged helix-turn-helix (wHTH) protein [Sphingobium sp. B11D3B]
MSIALDALRMSSLAFERSHHSAVAARLLRIEQELLQSARTKDRPFQTPAGHQPSNSESLLLGLDGLMLEAFVLRVQNVFDVPARLALLLAHLLSYPGQLVQHDDLKFTMGARTESNAIVKVYVCHLRRTLASFGFEDAIVTGPRSYALQTKYGHDIIKLVNSASASLPPFMAKSP